MTVDTPTWTRVGAGRAARTGRSTRSPSTGRTGGSPTRRTAASTRPRRTTPGHVFATTDGGKHWKDITGNLPDVPVDTRRARPVRHQDRSTSAPTSAPFVTHQRRPAAGTALGTGMPKVAVWQLDYDAEPRRARGRHPRSWRLHDAATAAPLPGAGRLQGRRRRAGRPRQHDRLHDHGQEHRQRRRDRRHGDRPAAGQHHVRSTSARAVTSVPARRALGRPDRPGRRQHRPDLHRPHRRQPAGLGRPRSSTTGSRSPRPRAPATTGSPHVTPIAADVRRLDHARARHPGRQGRRADDVPEHADQRRLPAATATTCRSPATWPATVYDATCTTPLTTTGHRGRRRLDRRVRQGRRAGRCGRRRHERHDVDGDVDGRPDGVRHRRR